MKSGVTSSRSQANIRPVRPNPVRTSSAMRNVSYLSQSARSDFTNSGAEAIEGAVKAARKSTRRSKLVAFEGGFHGDTLGALSLGGNPLYRDPFEPLLPGVTRLPFADAGALEAIDAATAAVVIEPVQGEGGVRIPPREYLAALRRRTSEAGALLVFDEVLTGFGRTGRRFAVDYWNVKPDIIVGGKGLTGGYMPMGMIAVDEKVVAQCEDAHADFMFFTYSSHPLACAIADRVLEIMEREKLVERAETVGARLGAQLKEELSGHPMVGDIRGAGFFWGIELVRDRERRIPYPPELRTANKVLGAAVKRGLFFYPSSGMAGPAGGDAMMITPPFIVDDNDIDFIVSTARAALDDVKPNLP